jgi:hypothetical protein
MNLTPVTSEDIPLSYVVLVKLGRLGGISEMPLLPLRIKREGYVLYFMEYLA